jgi:hypothetical protein
MNIKKLLGRSHPTHEAPVGADLSRPPPIYRPAAVPPTNELKVIIGLFSSIILKDRVPLKLVKVKVDNAPQVRRPARVAIQPSTPHSNADFFHRHVQIDMRTTHYQLPMPA